MIQTSHVKSFNCHYHVNKYKQRLAHSIPNSFVHFHETQSTWMKLVGKKKHFIAWTNHSQSACTYSIDFPLDTTTQVGTCLVSNEQMIVLQLTHNWVDKIQMCLLWQLWYVLWITHPQNCCWTFVWYTKQFHRSYFYENFDKDDSKMNKRTWWTCSQQYLYA